MLLPAKMVFTPSILSGELDDYRFEYYDKIFKIASVKPGCLSLTSEWILCLIMMNRVFWIISSRN